MRREFGFHLAWLCVINVVLCGIAVSLFGEPFRFWEHPLSALGAVRTPGGYPNTASRFIYTVSMCINGLYFFGLSVKLRTSSSRLQSRCSWFSLLTAVGMVFGSLPHDVHHTLHAFGTGSAVFGLLFLNTLAIAAFRSASRYRLLVFLRRIEWLALCVYAVLFVLDVPLKQTAQKPAAILLLLATFLVSDYFARPLGSSAGRQRAHRASSAGR